MTLLIENEPTPQPDYAEQQPEALQAVKEVCQTVATELLPDTIETETEEVIVSALPQLEPEVMHLVENNYGLAYSIAKCYRAEGAEPQDLQQVAVMALIMSAKRFDSGLGNNFATFAVPTIHGELKRYLRDKDWSVKLPRTLKERAINVRNAINHEIMATGKVPTDEQLAEGMGLPIEQVDEGKRALKNARQLTSLDIPVNTGTENISRGATLMDRESPRFDETITEQVLVAGLLATLDERSREVIRQRFWEGLSQEQIARNVGISQMQASRIIRKSIEVLKSVATLQEGADSAPRTS